MARPRPKLQWEELGNLPSAVLIRTLPDLEFEDRPRGNGISTGGTRSQSLTARASSLFRRGNRLYRTFVFRMGKEAGNANNSRITTSRVAISYQDLQRMHDGTLKTPAGLTPKMIDETLALMTDRKARIHKNNKRAHDHYLRKLQKDA